MPRLLHSDTMLVAMKSSMMTRTVLKLSLCVLATLGVAAHAQVPADPFNYARTRSYSYDPVTGLLASETVEPNNAASCVVQTFQYDAQGNVKTATTQNCAGAAAAQQFTSSTDTADTTAPASQTITVGNNANTTTSVSVRYASGIFGTSQKNALAQQQLLQYDPRFGAVLQLTDANQLTTNVTVDDFGRRTKEIYPDGTSTVWSYCWLSANAGDTSSNTPGCSALALASGEAPSDGAWFVHSERRDSSGAKMGPFRRVFVDRLGRVIRTSTEGFDGSNQPAGVKGGIIVQDTVYSASGPVALKTQPYFLSSGASTTGGTAAVGVTMLTYDVLGRTKVAYTADLNGNAGSQTFGASSGVSYGRYGSVVAAATTYTYQGLTTKVKSDAGQETQTDYDVLGHRLRVTDAAKAQIAYQYDAFGNLVGTKDALQNTISITFDIAGRKTQLNDPDSGIWLYCYDAVGDLVATQNALMRGGSAPGACPSAPNSGTTANAVANWTTFAYDALGRTTQRSEPEYATTWTYDQCSKGVGKLCETTTSAGLDRKEVYDSVGRPINELLAVSNGPSFANAVSYDSTTGRVASRTYPTGLQVGYAYTALGYPSQLVLNTAATVTPLPTTPGGTPGAAASLPAGTVLWSAGAIDAWGDVEQLTLGNGVVSSARFDAITGRAAKFTAGVGTSTTVANFDFQWDSVGHLSGRTDWNGDGQGNSVSETFTYGDLVDRLTGYSVSAPAIPGLARNIGLQYNALGLLLYKSDVGNYAYVTQGTGAVRPHALRSVAGGVSTTLGYDANGNVTSSTGSAYRTLAYTSFNLPDSQAGAQGPSGTPKYVWSYDEDHGRVKEVRTIASGTYAGTRTTWYVHPDNNGGLGFESEVNTPSSASASNPAITSNRHFLEIGGQTVAVLVSTGPLPSLSAGQTAPTVLSNISLVRVEYWHTDHLGSLVTTTDHAGAVTARYAYDPFGKRRFTNGNYDSAGSLQVDWSSAVNAGTARGFTGHEHLDDIGVVHMNGRLFDPGLGVFLQTDPFVVHPGNLQSFNRYGYCLNGPLGCIDPSGYDDQPQDIQRAMPGLPPCPTWQERVEVVPDPTAPGGSVDRITNTHSLPPADPGTQMGIGGLNNGGGAGGGGGGGGGRLTLGGNSGGGGGTSSGNGGGSGTGVGGTGTAPTGSVLRNVKDFYAGWRSQRPNASVFDNSAATVSSHSYQAGQSAAGWFDNVVVPTMRAAGWGGGADWEIEPGVWASGGFVPVGFARVATFRGIANPVSDTLARVVPGNINPATLGAPGAIDVFVTNASELRGLTAQQIAQKLAIPGSSSFRVIEFPSANVEGIASPIGRTNPGFIEGGRTAGGASEFVIPNGPIPAGAVQKIIP